MNLQAEGTKPIKGKRNHYCDYRSIFTEIILWILTFGIWAVIVVACVKSLLFLILAAVLYGFYLLFELCSYLMGILSHQKSPEEINKIVGELFRSIPSINFSCDIYTVDKRTDRDGTEYEDRKYVRSETDELHIFSSRDVSGTLYFRPGESSFVMLNLQSEINFADTISYSDYKEKRDKIKNYTPPFGDESEFHEYITIGDIANEDFLVNIYGGKSCFLSKYTYIFFVILTLGQIYKLILLFVVKRMSFVIKKVISTRYDISGDSKYIPYNPILIFPSKTFEYDKSDICHIDKSIKVKPPTPEELTKSLKYKDCIPQFEQSHSTNGTIVEVKNYNQNHANSNISPVNYQANQSVTNDNLANESKFGFNVNGNVFKK